MRQPLFRHGVSEGSFSHFSLLKKWLTTKDAKGAKRGSSELVAGCESGVFSLMMKTFISLCSICG